MNSYELRLKEQQAHALRLSQERACPHCHESISMLDSLCLVRGSGYTYDLNIQLPDDTIVPMRERDFNPQTMLLAEATLTSPSATGPYALGLYMGMQAFALQRSSKNVGYSGIRLTIASANVTTSECFADNSLSSQRRS